MWFREVQYPNLVLRKHLRTNWCSFWLQCISCKFERRAWSSEFLSIPWMTTLKQNQVMFCQLFVVKSRNSPIVALWLWFCFISAVAEGEQKQGGAITKATTILAIKFLNKASMGIIGCQSYCCPRGGRGEFPLHEPLPLCISSVDLWSNLLLSARS